MPAADARRARRLALERRLEGVHGLVEVADARAPRATRDPALGRGRFAGLPRVTVLTRPDLAEPKATRAWLDHLGPGAVALDARRGRGRAALLARLRELRPRGEVRLMVVGLPNLGKSSLINRLVGRASAPVGDRPGVTRGEQWLRVSDWLLLRDEPGVLPADEGDWRLWVLGVVAEGRYDPEAAALHLLGEGGLWSRLTRRWPQLSQGSGSPLEGLARLWGAVAPGGGPDLRRAAVGLIRRYRSGDLGRHTLEWPPGGAS